MKYFGKYRDTDVYVYTVENEYLKIEVMNLGATLVKFIYKPINRNVVLGFDSAEVYLENRDACIGATIGRCANRISGGHFCLDGCTYELTKNDGNNTLHSGNHGAHTKLFAVREIENGMELSALLKDGEDGFPGNLQMLVRYRLDGQNLVYEVEGTSDKKTIFAPTNHSYFNLRGKGDIKDAKVYIPSEKVSLLNIEGTTSAQDIDVRDTAFDFTSFKKIGDGLAMMHPNMFRPNGYDHNYCFEDTDDTLRAIMKYGDLKLEIRSDMPNVHFYTGNGLSATNGNDTIYSSYAGVCFECQYRPDAINHPEYISPVIEKDTVIKHYIYYHLSRL